MIFRFCPGKFSGQSRRKKKEPAMRYRADSPVDEPNRDRGMENPLYGVVPSSSQSDKSSNSSTSGVEVLTVDLNPSVSIPTSGWKDC